MKITTKTFLLLLLVVILSFTMISCSKGKEQLPPIPTENQGPTSPIISTNKNELLTKISKGMTIGSDLLAEEENKYVSSLYTIHTGYINYTIEYKANYASKRQNSEIYVKVFDNNFHVNRLFVYYKSGDLYTQSQDEKKSVIGFGSTSMFDLFYETITMFDMSGKLISPQMAELFDTNNVGLNIGTLIEQSRMRYIKMNTAESIEMTAVNLNYGQIKTQVNNLIKDTFGKFEKKFDLLSLKYFGLRISDLAVLEIQNMVGDFINVRLDNKAVETVIFEASGDMADGINTFTIEMNVTAKAGKKTITIDDTESPFLNDYPEMVMGRFNYAGTLFVPFFDMTYDATLRTILSSTDNTVNQVIFTINSINEEMGGMFYKDQMLYVDITGMNRQLNGAIELEKLNLPKIKFDGINLAQEITLLINDVLKIVQSMSGEDEYGENAELLQLVLDNIESNEKTNTMSIRITKELIETLYGEDVDIVQLLAKKLGVAPEVLSQIIGDNALENAVLILSYNVENGDIGLDLYSDDSLVFELRLSPIDPLPGDILAYPSSFNPDNFYWLEIPDNTILSISGSLSMQEVSKVQFDKLFGALFGDITGQNTPYTLKSNEQLDFTVDIMQVFNYFEDAQGQTERIIDQIMKIEIFKKGVLQVGVYSSSDPDYILVDFNVPIGPSGQDKNGVPYTQRPLKYKILKQKVKDGFDELLGEDNIFGMENIMDVLSTLLQSVRDSQSMQLRFVDSSLAFNLISDTVEEIIGIGHLNALLKARVKFATRPEEYLNINMQESQFVTPNIRPLENKTFESIYTMQWHEFVYTYFGDNLMRLKLDFLDESIKIVSGKYYYQPRAKLLDEIVSYYVTIQDDANGIKLINAVLDPDMPRNKNAALTIERALSIDPSINAVLPTQIPVLYDDDTFGYVNYIIEGFDVSNITISGMAKDSFWLVVGKGSVAETRFYISVEVLGRVILPLQERIQGELVYMTSNLGKPVVAEITIDPYTYAIRKAENPSWLPLPSTLNLSFESLEGLTVGDIVAINNINWDFDYSNIQYNGGVFFSHALYNSLAIAIKINIKSKIVAYLRFVDVINTSLPIDDRPYTEAIGSYTVDILETSSYTFPTGSTTIQQLRLYFEDGTYRVIGSKDHNQDDIEFYKNYLPLVLQWKHETIDYSTLKLVGTKAPLGAVDKNINITTIGSDSFTIGKQKVTLSIQMPSRAEATIGNASNIFAIIGYEKLGDGSFDYDNPIREMTSYTKASFEKNKGLGTFFEFNPYNQKALPNTVYLDVLQGGESRIQRKGYNVQWVESDTLMARRTYDGSGNLINIEYILRNVSTEEEYLLVTGILGDGNHTIVVSMIVHNIDAIYQDITYEGMDTNITEVTVDPYLSYTLPSYYTLMLKNGNEIVVENVKWFIELQDGKNWMLQYDGRSYDWIYAYIEAKGQGLNAESLRELVPPDFSEPTAEELDFFLLVIEKGEIPVDNRFVFSHGGGRFVIKSYIDATESVIAQEVFLVINILPRTVLYTDTINGYTQLDLYNNSTSLPQQQYLLDTYLIESTTMLNRLQYLLEMNSEYDNTIRAINLILSELRNDPDNAGLDNATIYALCYDLYLYRANTSEKNVLTGVYNTVYSTTPNATTEELKFYALQSYMQQKNNVIDVARVGVYFGDNPDTSTQKYSLNVRWTNLEEIIATLESSDGAVLGIILEGYIGYGQINQQLVRIPFRISRREIESIRFNKMAGYEEGTIREEVRNGVYYYYQIGQTDNESIMSVDYRYVYIGDENEATSLINSIMDTVILDNNIPQNQKSITIYSRLYEHVSTTEEDRFIMEYVESSIHNEDSEIRYAQIISEIKRLRTENIRSIFIDMQKPMGLVKQDDAGNKVFIEPSEYFYKALSQVSIMFADGIEGYYSPRYTIGDGTSLALQKVNFDKKILATDPTVYNIAIDPTTGNTYAYVSIVLTHLSNGSCKYPVTVKFKAILDEKGVIDGYPLESEIEPFDENGKARFLQGYKLPDRITIVYDKSGPVTFGNIDKWIIASPLSGFEEGDTIGTIPVESINVLNPSILDFRINLPCAQGEFTYHINFPQKYIGKTKYNAQAEDRNFSTLDIKSGIIEIDNIYDIYDPSKAMGFDTTKLPQKINPYAYEYGDVQYKYDDTNIIDTYFAITTNNSFNIEWKIVDGWINKKIDYKGTTIEENGEFVVAPILFATATIYSYYLLPDAFGVVSEGQQRVVFEQTIELYIKIKPLTNPKIVYDGLVDFSDNNNINFDPYDDPNNYGGNLVLPKDGLKVYFNDNMLDVHTFDPRASLRYYLLMTDSDDISKSYLYDSLMIREATTDLEKLDYHTLSINRIIANYAEKANISITQASENLLSEAYNAILNASSLASADSEKQRKFLIDYTTNLFEMHYNLSNLKAWQKLMTDRTTDAARAIIVYDYLYNINILTEAEMIEDLKAMQMGFDNVLLNYTNLQKATAISYYTQNFTDERKNGIITILDSRESFVEDRGIILNDIFQEGGIANAIERNAEIFNRLMARVSENSRFEILRLEVEAAVYTRVLALSTGMTVEEAAKAVLFTNMAKEFHTRTDLMDLLSLSLAKTIINWDGEFDNTGSNMWRVYLNSVIKRSNIQEIRILVEMYMSCSENNSINKLKTIIVNQLINIFDYDSEYMANYFDEPNFVIAERILSTIVSNTSSQLEGWQLRRAKAETWDLIVQGLSDESIFNRILNGDPDSQDAGRIDTIPLRAIAYERLVLSSYYPTFETRFLAIQALIDENDQEIKRSMIFKALYDESNLQKKAILLQILMGASRNVSDTQKEVTVIEYTQSGHNIIEIRDNKLHLYLLLPDGQRLEIELDIFSREIKDVLVPNVITNKDGEEIITEIIHLPNIYYIDPYNSETFRLPQQAEFEFETGYNLTLDIAEWVDYDGNVFYTRSDGSQTNKVFYYNLTQNSYRGGSYILYSYLTYGVGETAERQLFSIQVVVLNRTLKEAYNESYHFDNPISGRKQDIPASLTNDMFVDFGAYYKSMIPEEYSYSNFGVPVVPQIDWNKASYNPNGMSDSDILVQGGFENNVQGYLYYDNNLLTKTYNQLWRELYDEFAYITKPMAWSKFFETMISGERVVKTLFAGAAAVQIKALDDQIYDDMIIDAYVSAYESTNVDIREKMNNLMVTFRNNNFGLITDDTSTEWYIIFYDDLKIKAKATTLTAIEREVWDVLYSAYINQEVTTLSERRVEKWDLLFEMTGIWSGQQNNLAKGYLNDAYQLYRNYMLTITWDNLEKLARDSEAAIMSEIINTLRAIYGTTEQATIKAWDFLKLDDRIKGIIGETAQVKISADSWTIQDIMNMSDEIINEITFNAFTKTTNESEYKANFKIVNSLLLERLEQILEQLTIEYFDEYKVEALQQLKTILMEQALNEVYNIDAQNSHLTGTAKNLANWADLRNKRVEEATNPIDDTRASVEASNEGINQYERDYIVWSRLLEGAGGWLDIMSSIYTATSHYPSYEREYYAVEAFRQKRIEVSTQDMQEAYDATYFDKSLNAWNVVYSMPQSYDETLVHLENVLFRGVKQIAWEMVFSLFSTNDEKSLMNSKLESSDGALRYSMGWDRYYAVASSDRRITLNAILLYYYGYDIESNTYAGYSKVYEKVRQNPAAYGETTESLDSLYTLISKQIGSSNAIIISTEMVKRLLTYNIAAQQLYNEYVKNLKRTEWMFLYANKANPTVFNSLFAEDTLKSLAWQELWQQKINIGNEKYATIQGLFDGIVNEKMDELKSQAYSEICGEPSNKEIIEHLYDGINLLATRTVLWNRLYNMSDSEQRTAMDITYNIIIREGGEAGINAESRSWERYLNKNETSAKIKLLMNDMYDTYLKARAFEEYEVYLYEESTKYEENLYDNFILSYKKAEVWDEIYLEVYNATDNTVQQHMDEILLEMYDIYDGMGYTVQLIKSYALDKYMAELEEIVEFDIIKIRISNIELEYEYPAEISAYKVVEWDLFYNDGAKRAAMDDVLDVYYSKAAALDSPEFRNILTLSEREALDARIEEKIVDLIDLYFMEMTYDKIDSNPLYTSLLEDLYNEAEERYAILYKENNPQINVIKREAIKSFSIKNRADVFAFFENMIDSRIIANMDIYNRLTWDGYYALNEQENEEKAELMNLILLNAVSAEIMRLKEDSINYLYNEMQQEAIQKVETSRENIYNTIKKNAVWIENFGESIYSLKAILNNIMLVDANEKTIKDIAWNRMLGLLSMRIDYIGIMFSIRNNITSQNPSNNENVTDELSWDALYAMAGTDILNLMQDIISQYAEFENESKHLAWRQLEAFLNNEEATYNIMLTTKTVVYGEDTNLDDKELNRLAFERINEIYPLIGERFTKEFINKVKSEAWQDLSDFYNDNAIMLGLFQEMYNLEMYYHTNNMIESKAICWDRMVAMAQSIETTLATIDPRYSEDELRAFATDCILDLLSGAERAVLWNAIEDIVIDIDESKFEVWQENFGENELSFNTLLESIIATVGIEEITIKDVAWKEVIAALQMKEAYKNLMDSTKDIITLQYPDYNNDQRDIKAWEYLYAAASASLKNIMNMTLNYYDFGTNLHLYWQQMYLELQAEIALLNEMQSIKAGVALENPALTEKEINYYSYDTVSNASPEIGERLNAEYMYEHKRLCFEMLLTYYVNNEMMTELLDRLFANNQNIPTKEMYANSWDNLINMSNDIENALSAEPSLTLEEKITIAIDTVLANFDAKVTSPRAPLWQAIKNKSKEITSQKIDSEVYETLYSRSAQSEKLVLQDMLATAEGITGSTDTIENQAKAIELYITFKETKAVEYLEGEAIKLYGISYENLNSTQKLNLYDSLHIAQTSQNLVFYTVNKAEQYWDNRNTDTSFGRMNIFWDQKVLEQGGDIASVFVGNAYKAYDNASSELNYEENTFIKNNFLYKNRQITIDMLDFYGDLDIYAGEVIIDTRNYYNELVIDPLNPYIPAFAEAYGKITGENPNVEINGQMYSYIGKVAVSYENRIYEFLYDEEGTEGENITAMASPGLGGGVQNINIKVYYLDRQPIMYYANSQNYTIEQKDEMLNLFPLSVDNIGGNKYMTLDPLNESIYDTINKKYILPTSLVAMFTDSYADGIISTLFMNDIFNNRLDISDINWDLFDATISLTGLAATNISINKYTSGGIERTSSTGMDKDFWKIQLKVLERKTERVLEVNQQGLGSSVLSSIFAGVLQSTNKIDPYNVMASFPNNVRVEFIGGGDSKLLTNITWQFAEGRGLEYLKLPEVITGSIGENAMFITAGFKCVSETIWINFPIQKRHIDISVDGSDEIRYLQGGTIYLIKGADVMTQLNKYKSLFYNFAAFGETEDWSEVPLEFIMNDVSQISTNEVGSYSIRGRLGEINDPNVIFNIIVIDPKLYAIDSNGVLNNKVYYDNLSVAINSFGVRINGKEDEEGFLPNFFVQLEKSDTNGNVDIGYNEFRIKSRYWDISGKNVVFTCEYTFLDENDDIEKLAGSLLGSRQLTFTINIPLKTYLYSQIDESMVFDINNSNGTNILKLTLGQSLKMSDLPKAIMHKGTVNEIEVTLLWDLSTINVNKAGSYNLYGYYRDYTSSYMAKSKNLVVVIDKKEFKGTEEIRTLYSLKQTYTGLYIEVVPDIDDVLRENGSFSQLRLGREVIVEYLTEAKYLIGELGDFRSTPFKNAGVYYARITINDYNAKGQIIYKLEIMPIEIDPADIIFDYGEGASTISVQIPNWPQNIEEKERLFYTQFRLHANQNLGTNIANISRAAAYDTLFVSINNIGQELLTNRYDIVLSTNFPEYATSDDVVKQGMRMMAKAIVWEEITPIGVAGTTLIPYWPTSNAEKEALIDEANAQLDAEGGSYTINIATAQAYDNLYNRVMEIGKIMLSERLAYIILTRFPSYNEASNAIQTSMMIEAKVIVWSEIVSTGLVGNALINNWPRNIAEKEAYLDAEYTLLLNLTYAGSENEFFIKQVKAKAFDELKMNIYTTAQEKLQMSLDSILQINYPLYSTYGVEQKALILIEAKAMAWDAIIPGDTVSEQSYVYDGKDHLPLLSGLPKASIIGWPQTIDEKVALLNFAYNENASFTATQAKARAYDNLLEAIYSNIYALQKLTSILENVIAENYPAYNLSTTSYEAKQALLIEAKATAWDTRVLVGDTVEEIYYTFNYWYANMNNAGMIINSRPKEAGTYEITLIIDPLLNINYRLKADAVIITTISIRRALIDQSFANEMVYKGTTISPTCNGLHNENNTLPQGVTITYSYTKDGQAVSFIKDVGQYTFSATVNGGNNYPSWTVEDQVIDIVKKELIIDVGTVQSGYLEKLKGLNSSITFDGIVGNDLPSMFGYLICESDVSPKHMVGEYPINFVGFKDTFNSEKIYYLNAFLPSDDVLALNPVLFGNYNITIINGIYDIKKASEDAIIITSQAELNIAYDELQEGSSVIWYLAPGVYDTFTIDKNVGITIIGCYDTNAPLYDYSTVEDAHEAMMMKVKNDAMDIVTIFKAIVINRGAITLDIIKIYGRINESAIYLNQKANSLELRRSYLTHTEVFSEGGSPISQNATGIGTSASFKGLLRTDRTYFEGFTAAIYVKNGNELQIVNSRFNRNKAGVISFGGNVHMEGSRFEFTRGNAVYLELSDYTAINCSFISNEVAIKSLNTNTYDLWLENRFSKNVKDIESL